MEVELYEQKLSFNNKITFNRFNNLYHVKENKV